MKTAAELMAENVVLRMEQVAVVLGFVITRGDRRGQPSRAQAIAKVREGKLALVDPEAPPTQYSVSVSEVQRYIDGRSRIEQVAS